jgi:hypothetical protein
MAENTSITASFVVTLDEIKTAHFAAISIQQIKAKSSRSAKIQSIIAYGILAACIIFMVFRGNFSFKMPTTLSEFIIFIPPILFMAVLWATLKYNQKNSFNNFFDQLPAGNKHVEFTFSQNEIIQKMEGLFESKNQWGSYIKVARTQKGFLFFTSLQSYVWIPSHAFQSKEDADALADIARKLVPIFFES